MAENKLIHARATALRERMRQEGLAAFVVPTLDPHGSEYMAPHWACREWLTGFTGSAGLAVLTADDGALWTDSRYFLQAAEQLSGTPFRLLREGEADTPSLSAWLATHVDGNGRVGFYAPTMSRALADTALGSRAVALDVDFFDELWSDRPALPAAPLSVQPVERTGETVAERLQKVRAALAACAPAGAALVLGDLADIAWALNLRGNDIPYNPVFFSYLVVHADRAVLFLDERQATADIVAHLAGAATTVAPYASLPHYLSRLRGHVALPTALNVAIWQCCTRNSALTLHPVGGIVEPLRALKTTAELAGFRRAMLHDGVALVQFRRWLDERMAAGETLTEVDVDTHLTQCRAARPLFRGLSFATIAGYAAHGAIVHYEATPAGAAVLAPRGLLLLDSGAQYEDGTTDITRTIALGETTAEERRVYTLVLKGHIQLSRLRFPEGTTGLQLDTAARAPLWQEGYDFGHGTGHGVGAYLCVHEGPQQIRKDKRACTDVGFRAGMTITDEPGLYLTGRFGVRIENVLAVVPADTTPFGRFLRFEPLTLCPIDTAPIERSLLTSEEIAWFDAYHRTVCEALLPLLTDPLDRAWLEKACRPLDA